MSYAQIKKAPISCCYIYRTIFFDNSEAVAHWKSCNALGYASRAVASNIGRHKLNSIRGSGLSIDMAEDTDIVYECTNSTSLYVIRLRGLSILSVYDVLALALNLPQLHRTTLPTPPSNRDALFSSIFMIAREEDTSLQEARDTAVLSGFDTPLNALWGSSKLGELDRAQKLPFF